MKKAKVTIGVTIMMLFLAGTLAGAFDVVLATMPNTSISSMSHGEFDFDMLIGSLNNTVVGYRNIGSLTYPQWMRESSWDTPEIPHDPTPGVDRASPTIADLDNDGDYDLLISDARFHYPPVGYKNIGNKTHPVWERCSAWDVPDLNGYEQNPDFASLDNDTDYDLCVAGAYLQGNPHYAAFLENTGTPEGPSWTIHEDFGFNPGVDWPSPAWGNLDSDGDWDLFFGGYSENCCVAWEMTGTWWWNPEWTRRPEWDVSGLPTMCMKRPSFVDLDYDGDLDLMIGVGDDASGHQWRNITAYENTGTLTSPQWTRKPDWDILLPEMGWIRPAFADLDEDWVLKNTGVESFDLSFSGDIIAFMDPNWPWYIKYYNIFTERVISTGTKGYHPSVNGEIIAFPISYDMHPWWVEYYNISSGTMTNTGVMCDNYASISGDIIAFSTFEGDYHEDLNGDGDQTDHVIRYYKISTGDVVNTKVAGEGPSIDGDIIAFEDLGPLIRYYNISERRSYDIAEGVWPSVNGDIIAFQTYQAGAPWIIKYYDISTHTVTSTGGVGEYPSVTHDLIAFSTWELWIGQDLSGDGDTTDWVVRYCEIKSDGTVGPVINTGVAGRGVSADGKLIAFFTYESDINQDLNGDGDKTDPVIRLYRIPRVSPPVGGICVPVDKLGLLAPYISLASTIMVAAIATTVYVKRIKHKKEKQ